MIANFELDNIHHTSWLLLHQTHNLVLRCEASVFAQDGLTPQKHAILMAIRYIEDPVTPTEVANWLDRSTNSISLIIDRMVKKGLVKRTRNLRDRRSVRLSITEKGNEMLDKATTSGWELIQHILSPLSEDELVLLSSMLKRVRQRAFEYINSEQAIETMDMSEADDTTRFSKT
jgi:DNA-binding MarR family transcriptional regulator